MRALFADDGDWGPSFERLLFLVRDWEHDEEPLQLEIIVSTY